MSGSIVQAVAQVERSVAAFLTAEFIVEACREVGHTRRERELGPAKAVWAFLLQVIYGNTACAHVVRLAELTCSTEAYCAARARLPLPRRHLLPDTTHLSDLLQGPLSGPRPLSESDGLSQTTGTTAISRILPSKMQVIAARYLLVRIAPYV